MRLRCGRDYENGTRLRRLLETDNRGVLCVCGGGGGGGGGRGVKVLRWGGEDDDEYTATNEPRLSLIRAVFMSTACLV